MTDIMFDIICSNKFGAYQILKKLKKLEEVKDRTSFLSEKYNNILWSQRFWHINNKNYNIVFCGVCNKNPAEYTKKRGYISCSKKCVAKKISLISSLLHKDGLLVGKAQKTCVSKYGVDNPAKVKKILEKSHITCRKKYGKKFYFQTNDFKKKSIATHMEKYGVNNYKKTEVYKHSMFLRNKSNMEKSLLNEYKIIEYGVNTTLYHKTCNKTFSINRHKLICRKLSNITICTFCKPDNDSSSSGEKSLYKFLKSLYHKEILKNDKNIIPPYEIDIYLPDLGLAIEYNGTYFHADKRFYSGNDKIYGKLARQIWKKDGEKEFVCNEKNIDLLVVWEYDWINNREETKNNIYKIINYESNNNKKSTRLQF